MKTGTKIVLGTATVASVVLIYLATRPAVAKALLQGVVSDANTGALLHGVTVTLNNKRVITDHSGRYSFQVEVGDYVLGASMAGYQLWEEAVQLTSGEHEVNIVLRKATASIASLSFVKK